jgi:hypothetical protein
MPGTPDPLAGKSMEEIMRKYGPKQQWPFDQPLVVTC